MKKHNSYKLLIAFIGALISMHHTAFSQEYLDSIPHYERQKKEAVQNFEYFSNRLEEVAKEQWKNYWETKEKSKIIDRVVYTLDNGNQVYTKIKLTKGKKRGKSVFAYIPITCEFLTDVFYVHNNAVFMKVKGKERRYLNEGIAYHPNGKIWYKKTYLNKEDKTTYYNGEGAMVYSYTQHFGDHYLFNKEEYNNMLITRNSRFDFAEPDMYRVNDDYTYYGYNYAGQLHSSTGEVITGFFLPLDIYFGGASLLHVQRPNGQKGYWALYVGKKLETVFEDVNVPAPDMNAVLAKHQYDAYYIKKLKKEHYKTIFGNIKLKKELYTNIPHIQYGPTNPSYSGYGMRIKTSDGKFPGSNRTIEVGIFKNGKLDGPGYQMEMELIAEYNAQHSQLDVSRYADIKGAIGKFENGILEQGREFAKDRAMIVMHNYISNPKWKNIDYTSHYGAGKPVDIIDFKDWFSLLAKKQQKIYIQELGRAFTVTRIDQKTKRIYFMSDKPGVEISVGPEQKGLYCIMNWSNEYTVSCNPNMTKTLYETVPVEYDNILATKTSSRDVLGGSMITTTYEKVTTRLGTRQKKVGTTQVPCYKCNGTGKITYSGTKSVFAEIDFDR